MPVKGYVFYNKQRKCFCAQYGKYNPKTGKITKRTKSFKTEEDAKRYLKTIMYPKGNKLFIEHHGIPLCEFMKHNLKTKLDSGQISLTQYGRVTRTIEQIEKIPIGTKNIDEITSEELQGNINYYNYLSKSSINKIFQLYNQTFKIGFNRGFLTRNPMVDILNPKVKRKLKKLEP